MEHWKYRYDKNQTFTNKGKVKYPFIAITPRSTLTGVVAPDKVLSMGQIGLFNI